MLTISHYVVCPYCNIRYNRDKIENVPVGRRYYHTDCYKKYQEKKGQEEKDQQILEQYIKELLSIDKITPKVKKQIKEYIEINHYTYSGIYKSLVWFYEIKKNPKDKANGGIGIVPYIYEDSKQYYYNLFLIAQINKEKKQNYQDVTKEVTITDPIPKRKKIRLFNL